MFGRKKEEPREDESVEGLRDSLQELRQVAAELKETADVLQTEVKKLKEPVGDR